MKYHRLYLVIVVSVFLLASVIAVRVPIVGNDYDNWGDILNNYLISLAGQNATELNQTMVNGTNIYKNAINSSHIIDSAITINKINLTSITLSQLLNDINFLNNTQIDYLFVNTTINNSINSQYLQGYTPQGISNLSGWFHNTISHVTYLIDSNEKLCIGTNCINNPYYKVTIEGGANVTGNFIMDGVGIANMQSKNLELYNNISAGNICYSNGSNCLSGGTFNLTYSQFAYNQTDYSNNYSSNKFVQKTGDNMTGNYSLNGVLALENQGDASKIAIGENATIRGSGIDSLFIGANAGFEPNWPLLNTGTYNIGIGRSAMGRMNAGTRDIAIGYNALWNSFNNASRNIVIGHQAMQSASSASDSVVIGDQAGYAITSGSRNSLIGAQAGDALTVGKYNSCLGYACLTALDADYNTALGYASGASLTSGANNIFLGALSGYYQTTGTNRLLIDNQLRASAADELEKAIIYGQMGGSASVQNLTFNARTNVNGTFRAADNSTLTNLDLKSNIDGRLGFGRNSGSNVMSSISGYYVATGTAGDSGGLVFAVRPTSTGALTDTFFFTRDGKFEINKTASGIVNEVVKLTNTGSTAGGGSQIIWRNTASDVIGAFIQSAREDGTTTKSYLSIGVRDGTNTNEIITINSSGNTRINANVTIDKNIAIAGNTTYNSYYGEMWNKANSGFEVVDLVSVETYVKLNNLTCGNINGFLCSDGNLTAQVGGLYKVEASFSQSDGASGQHGFKIFVNETGQDDCYNYDSATTNAKPGEITCFVKLNPNDRITFRVDDHANPVNDVTFYSTNVNLFRISN